LKRNPGGARLSSVTRAIAVLALTVSSAAAQAPQAPQAPKLGDINFYGLRKVTPEKLLARLELKAGDPLPPSKGDLEERIEEIPGVVQARVEAVCCEGATAILFIGVEEKGSPHFDYHAPPAGSAALPQEIIDAYREFLSAVERAARTGNTAEDLTAGHSRMADPAAAAVQEKFAGFAAANLSLLSDVLRHAGDVDQRAIAAAIIGYSPRKQQVLNDLQYALQDADEAVRGSAVRSLKAVAVLAQKQPQLGLKISPTWFVEMLNSLALSDRAQSAEALVILTDQRDAATLDLMRTRALAALVEMARWKTLRYALPAFLLVGRLAGMPDQQIQQDWQKGDRDNAIRKALAPLNKARRGLQ
jgi:hypothetical protein